MVLSKRESEATALRPILETLLFVAADPVTPQQVARAVMIEEAEAQAALEAMRGDYGRESGLQVVRVAGGYQLRTRPEYAEYVTRFLQPDPQRLSRQALETLAVVAYQQPITQPEIDALRGVSSSGVLKTLLERGLICEAGRKETPGRPILYSTTPDFLKHFGLCDLNELPNLEEAARESAVEADLRAA
jgi:segregation and condensation protein B